MFGRKKKTAVHVVSAPSISAEDHALLTELAHEIKGCFDCGNGDLLLDDAEEVYIATMGVPAPVIEIQYPDRLVSMHMEVYHYTPEELGE